tara:strand:+ start:313 stop:657 length:345 start_codon:yes stop_codon:yes gene_type:complete
MTDFPLYESLNKSLPKKDLTVKQKEDFIKKVGQIDGPGKELIYVLICNHIRKSSGKEDSEMFPYGGSMADNKVDFDFSKFPIDLRQMLYKFVLMHIKNMDVEKIRVLQQNSPSL